MAGLADRDNWLGRLLDADVGNGFRGRVLAIAISLRRWNGQNQGVCTD